MEPSASRSPALSSSSSASTSRLSLAEQSTTTSTTTSVSTTITNTEHLPLSSLEYIEQQPVHPPSYNITHQTGASTRFPVYDHQETYILPKYTPAIQNLTLVLRKVEWLTPYEHSPSRSWKNTVMELNSTQLNFYSLDGLPLLNRVKQSKSKKHYTFNEIEQDFLINTINSNPSKYLTSSNLIASYSLQYAKFGIPIDYKKRNCCLRLRLETEQMIVQFSSLDNMINWANYLSTGINVSLDLDSRELPTDRTVPRRRRNRRNRNRAYSDSELIRRELSGVPSSKNHNSNSRSFTRRASSGEQFLKSKFSKIFGRKRSNSAKSIDNNNNNNHDEVDALTFTANQHNTSHSRSRQSSQVSNQLAETEIDEFPYGGDISTIREQQEDEDEEEEEEEEELEEEEDLTAELRDEAEDEDDTEIHSIRELRDDSDDESIHQSPDEEVVNLFNKFSFNNEQEDDEDEDEKWIPTKKVISRRKYLKDSLRCIKLLPNDECWVGKSVVKSSRPPSFKTCNEVAKHHAKTSKNKFVKEYIVGPHGFLSMAH